MVSVNQQFIEVYRELKSSGNIKSNTDFATDLGISPQLLSEILGDRTNIRHNLLQIFCIKYGVSISYLYFGTGPKMVTNENGNLYGNPHGNVSDTKALYKEGKKVDVQHEDKSVMNNVSGIPFYEQLYATAGNFTDLLNTSKPSSFINLPQIEDCTAVLPVYGSSMKGLIEPGDLIAIKELAGRSEFDPTVPYLVITNEHRMIKYLRADDSDPETIWAESTNHKPFRIEAHNILYVYAIKCVIRFF